MLICPVEWSGVMLVFFYGIYFYRIIICRRICESFIYQGGRKVEAMLYDCDGQDHQSISSSV
jgi:hypothetical protein